MNTRSMLLGAVLATGLWWSIALGLVLLAKHDTRARRPKGRGW